MIFKKVSKNNITMFLIFLITFLALMTSLFNIAFISDSEEKTPDYKENNQADVESITENQDTVLTSAEKHTLKDQNEQSVVDSEEKINTDNAPPIDYTKLYPNLYCQRPKKQINPNKTIFLTFDDGPSERTSKILDILKEKNIKATFFVVGTTSKQAKLIMKRIVDEGHTIGIHSYTHKFRQIYSSVQDYLEDFNNIYNCIYENTGVKPTIFRFPGGSKNSFNKNNYRELITELTRRGFDYFDWNLSVGDAVSRTPTPVENCINNVLNFSATRSHAVVLMHDAKPKYTTVQALPYIVDGLINQGFSFDKLSNDINPAPYSLSTPYR